MQRLVIGSLALAGLMQAATGCIIVDDTDDNAGDCPRVDDGACFGVTAACPVDAVSYTVFTQNTSASGAFEDTFDCGQAGFVIVDPGEYDVRVEAEGDGVLYGAEPLINQAVAAGDQVVAAFDFPIGEGFFWLNWTLEDSGGAPLECEDIAAAGLEVESVLLGPDTPTQDVLKCHYTGWQTRGLELGDYEVSVSLLDEDDAALASSDAIPGQLTVDSELAELPPITFSVIR